MQTPESPGPIQATTNETTPVNDGSDTPRESLRRAGVIAWSLLGMLLLAAATVWILYMMREIFPPLVLALMVIFLLNPLVSALERRGIRRGMGTGAIYLVFISAVVIAVLLLAPPLVRQVKQLQDQGPELRQNAIETVDRFTSRFGVDIRDTELGSIFGLEPTGSTDPADATVEPVDSTEAGATSTAVPEESKSGSDRSGLAASLFRGVRGFASSALHTIITFILAPIFALYLLIDLPKIQRSFVHYLPPRYRDEWLGILERSGQAVGSFFRGQLVVAAIVGVMSAFAFYLLELPFWLPIGLLAGFFNIIPLIGPFVGGGIAVIVGGVAGGPGLALKAGLAMLVVQQIDNHFISPNVMGRAVRLHPVAVMVALLAGGTLAGLWGMLLAVPATAVARIVALHYYETRVLGTFDPRMIEPGDQVRPPPGSEDISDAVPPVLEDLLGSEEVEGPVSPAIEPEPLTGPRGRPARRPNA